MSGRYSAVAEAALGTIPVGFDLSASPVPLEDLSALRFRKDDKSLLQVMFYQTDYCRFKVSDDIVISGISVLVYLQIQIRYTIHLPCKLLFKNSLKI